MTSSHPKTVLPPTLKQGDLIGYFSPSSPATHFAPNRYKRAKTYLKDQGFNLLSGKLSGQATGDNSIDRRLQANVILRNGDG